MRPGVQATVLRNRVKRVRKRNPDAPHRFSLRRLLLLVAIGTIILIAGIALTVLGYEKGAKVPNLTKDQHVMYKTFGPIGCVVGTALLLGASFYYYCFGTGDGFGPRAPQSPSAASTSYHPISSIRSTASNSHHHRHHGSHRSHHHHDNHDGSVPLNNEYLSQHDHHQLMMAAGCAPLAASETASIRDTPTGVPSDISLIVDGYHHKHPTTSSNHSNHDGADHHHGATALFYSNHDGKDHPHGATTVLYSNHGGKDVHHGATAMLYSNPDDKDLHHGATAVLYSNPDDKDLHHGATAIHYSNHDHKDLRRDHGAGSSQDCDLDIGYYQNSTGV